MSNFSRLTLLLACLGIVFSVAAAAAVGEALAARAGQ